MKKQNGVNSKMKIFNTVQLKRLHEKILSEYNVYNNKSEEKNARRANEEYLSGGMEMLIATENEDESYALERRLQGVLDDVNGKRVDDMLNTSSAVAKKAALLGSEIIAQRPFGEKNTETGIAASLSFLMLNCFALGETFYEDGLNEYKRLLCGNDVDGAAKLLKQYMS